MSFLFKVFASEFLRYEKGYQCSKTNIDVLKRFPSNSKTLIDLFDARMKCEKYCAIEDDCWGCSANCESSCQWNAIPDCGSTEMWSGMIAGDISQKPGSTNNCKL